MGCQSCCTQSLPKLVVNQFHEGHLGSTRMKALARIYVWWPGITQDVERCCTMCSLVKSSKPAHQQSCYIQGLGPLALGPSCVLTMQGRGLAERAVQEVKRRLKKVQKGSIRSGIATILFPYWLIPQTTTETSLS